MQIEFGATDVREQPREGKEPMRFQKGLFHRGDGVVLPFEAMLRRGQQPYPPGRYEVSQDSFGPNRYGDGVEFRPRPGARVEGPAVNARPRAAVPA